MSIRDPWPGADHEGAGEPDAAGPTPDNVAYRVPLRHPVMIAAVAVALAVGGWFTGQRAGWLICGVLAAGLLAYALRDLIAPVRLRADRHGVEVVHGYASRRRLAWGDVDRVRVDERFRLGREVQTLELDAGDDLFLLSARDLGAAPTDVAETLNRLRSSASPSSGS